MSNTRKCEKCGLCRLPKTADGVAVVTGDVVFGFVVHGSPNGRGQTGYGLQPLTVMTAPEHGDEGPEDWAAYYNIRTGFGLCRDSGTMYIGHCYSSPNTAENAAR